MLKFTWRRFGAKVGERRAPRGTTLSYGDFPSARYTNHESEKHAIQTRDGFYVDIEK